MTQEFLPGGRVPVADPKPTSRGTSKKTDRYTLKLVLGIVGTGMGIGASLMGLALCLRDADVKETNALEQNTAMLQEKGLIGELPIIDLREVPGYDFKGQFFFYTGTFQGEAAQMMKLAWRPKGKDDEYVKILAVPTRKVSYLVVDNPNTKPTVQFMGMTPESVFATQLWAGIAGRTADVDDYAKEAVGRGEIVITLSRDDWRKSIEKQPVS